MMMVANLRPAANLCREAVALRCRFSTVLRNLIHFRFFHQSLRYFNFKLKKYAVYLIRTSIVRRISILNYFICFYLIEFL